jgi:hypothetical protein
MSTTVPSKTEGLTVPKHLKSEDGVWLTPMKKKRGRPCKTEGKKLRKPHFDMFDINNMQFESELCKRQRFNFTRYDRPVVSVEKAHFERVAVPVRDPPDQLQSSQYTARHRQFEMQEMKRRVP